MNQLRRVSYIALGLGAGMTIVGLTVTSVLAEAASEACARTSWQILWLVAGGPPENVEGS